MTREKKKNKKLFSQQQKGEPITYNGSVEPIPLDYVSEEWPTELTLKISASPQDWNTLHQLADSSPEYLGRLIFLHITRPVQKQFLSREGRNLPRGFDNEARQIFMEESRIYVTVAFTVLSYWAKHPLTAWPDNLQAVIRNAEKRWTQEIIWPPKKQSPKNERQSVDVLTVVRYLLNLKTRIRRDELGLDNLENMDNERFHKTYFKKNMIKAAMAIQNNYIQNHGGPPPMDVLYEFVPGLGLNPIKE